MTETLIRRLDEGVLTLTLNRPERLNALNPPLVHSLLEATRAAAENPDVVVTGERPALAHRPGYPRPCIVFNHRGLPYSAL